MTRRDPGAGGAGVPERVVVDPRGRSKVYRPLRRDLREAAIARGLAAYERGEFYLAHEELEPAWMGTDDAADRELLGGLIKLAAAFVHAVRGNPAGVATNLRGARERLGTASAAGADRGIDLPALLGALDDRLARIETMTDAPTQSVPDPPHDVAGPPGRARRPPLDLAPPTLVRRTPA